MAKKKEAVYSAETYPKIDDDLVGNAAAVLEQYRQSVIGRDPLPLEWLFDSLRDGEVKDLAFYSETARQNEADHEAAIEAAGGPFDASYNPPPVLLGEEQANAAEEAVAEEPAAEEEPAEEEKSTVQLAVEANTAAQEEADAAAEADADAAA